VHGRCVALLRKHAVIKAAGILNTYIDIGRHTYIDIAAPATLCATTSAAPSMAAKPQGTTTRSIKYALGPQFGTIAFAGAILTLVDLARSTTDQARHGSHLHVMLDCSTMSAKACRHVGDGWRVAELRSTPCCRLARAHGMAATS
jgi:hypothetical protein